MRRGRFLRGAVAPVWCEGVTAAQVQDFLETYRRTREIYGHDASHEAVLLTLRRVPPNHAAYFLTCARAIARAGYHDGGRGLGAFKTWDREVTERSRPGLEPSDVLWGSARPGDPTDLACAREALRRLPLWLIDRHLTTGFRVRKPCWAHGPAAWIFHETRTGGAVQCRACLAERQRRRRHPCDTPT